MQLLRCLLFSKRGIDSVITLARRIPVTDAESVKVLGEGDLLIHWKKSVRTKASSYSQADWEDLPESLLLRQIKFTVNQPGFRVNTFYMVTPCWMLKTIQLTLSLIFISSVGMSNFFFGISKPPWVWISCGAKRRTWCARKY